MGTGEFTTKREIWQEPEHGQVTSEESIQGTRTPSKPVVWTFLVVKDIANLFLLCSFN